MIEADTDMKVHDDVFIASIDRRDKIKKQISKTLSMPPEEFDDDIELQEIINQLLRENNPTIQILGEELWIYLAELQDLGEEACRHNPSSEANSFYDRKKAKTYIDAHWKDYNPAYPAFSGGGGDCANFVSQVLYAGGMPWVNDGFPNHYTWYTNWYCMPGASNRDGDRRISLSWKVAASFKKQWQNRAARHLVISYKNAIDNMDELAKQIFIGDPVQFCYANGVPYHTLVVTGYTWDKEVGVNDIVLASHTIDSNRRSLYNTMLKYPKDYRLRLYIIKEGE